MRLTRRVTFSSGHRYWLDELSEDENRRLFGKWASRHNHGHNYVLEATVSGRIDPRTGMVINIKTLDRILKERIVSRFDQRSINDEVPELKGVSPTLENLIAHFAKALSDLPGGAKLATIRLYETPTLFADLIQNGDTHTMTLTRGYHFSASHRLHVPGLSDAENLELFGKCNNPSGHGHNYELEITVSSEIHPKTGMMVDIEELDRIVHAEVVDRYDHKHLNEDIEEFRGVNPTSEVLAKTIWERLRGKLPVELKKVLLRETPRNFFEYAGEDE